MFVNPTSQQTTTWLERNVVDIKQKFGANIILETKGLRVLYGDHEASMRATYSLVSTRSRR